MASNPITNTWTLTKIRVRLAMRNRTFLFFSLIMPLGFLFFFVLVFSKGSTGWIGYILGAVLTLTVMGSFWGLSVQLVMFREAGILRRFRLAPLGAGPMLASSILANYLLVVPSVIIEILACKWALHMPGWGNLWAVFLLITVGSAAFSAFGLIVASEDGREAARDGLPRGRGIAAQQHFLLDRFAFGDGAGHGRLLRTLFK